MLQVMSKQFTQKDEWRHRNAAERDEAKKDICVWLPTVPGPPRLYMVHHVAEGRASRTVVFENFSSHTCSDQLPCVNGVLSSAALA